MPTKKAKLIDEYTTEVYKYAYDNDLLPLITILGRDDGKVVIFADNERLTHTKKIQVLEECIKTCKMGIKAESDAMKNATVLDPKRIYKA